MLEHRFNDALFGLVMEVWSSGGVNAVRSGMQSRKFEFAERDAFRRLRQSEGSRVSCGKRKVLNKGVSGMGL